MTYEIRALLWCHAGNDGWQLRLKKRRAWLARLFEDIGRTVSRFLFYPVIYLRSLPPGKERAALSVFSRSFDSAGIFGLAGPGAVTAICRHTTS